MSESVFDRPFYQEAYEMIFNWLTPEEKIQFNLELLDDEQIFRDNDYLSLLLRLIRFVQVKYVNLKKYTDGIFNNLTSISEKSSGTTINDVIFSYEDEKFSLFDIHNSLDQETTSEAFQFFLEEIGLQTNFEKYLSTLKSKEEINNGRTY